MATDGRCPSYVVISKTFAFLQVNVVFMVIALVTVFRSKRGSIKRNKSMKRLEDNHKPNLDLFKYVLQLLLFDYCVPYYIGATELHS